jgi:rod shape-determining protein MreC
MFVDSRFDYLSRVRYYAATAVTPLQFMANLPSQASEAAANLFRSRDDLAAENAKLRDELLMQQYQLQKLDHLVAENQRLNELLKSSAIVDEEVMRAQLTGESPDPYVKRILINKGSRDGVFIGQPVLDASGLMGQVVEVEPLSSWVLLITDPQHSTPVQINRNGVRAIASGTRDTLHQLTLNNVPNTEDVKVGDVLVTSGIGGRFPPGYPVGVVSSVRQDPAQPFADVLVTPTAQISRSRNLLLVFVQEQPAPPAEAPAPAADAATPPPEGGATTDGVAPPATDTNAVPAAPAEPEAAAQTEPEATPAPAPQEEGSGDGE